MKEPRFLSGLSCGICGYSPETLADHGTSSVIRYWDPDDGWRIGHLCPWCWEDVRLDRPKPEDFAYQEHNADVCTGEPETDEDPIDAL